MSRSTRVTIIAAALASAGVIAFAANTMDKDGENQAATLATAKISLGQAITSAEQHTGGKAAKAEFEQTKAGWAYEVEIVNGGKTVDVRVNPDTGTVISAVDDKIDQDNEHDERD